MSENKLDIDERQENGEGIVLRLEGRIDTSTAPGFEQKACEAAAKDNVILDMEKVAYISSAGLRAVLLCHKKSAAKNHKLTLRNLTPGVREVFTISGLGNVLNIV